MVTITQYPGDGEAFKSCGFLRFENGTAEISEKSALLLNQLVANSEFEIFCFQPTCNVIEETAMKAIKLLMNSQTVKAIYFHSEKVLFLCKSALGLVDGFRSGVNFAEVITGFVNTSLSLRRFGLIEVGVSNAEQKKIESEKVNNDFESFGLKFQQVDPETVKKKEIEIVVTNNIITEKEIVALVQQGFDAFNSQRYAEAVSTLRKVTSVNSDMPQVFFLQALAEVQQGLLPDAMKSLMFMMERDPGNVEGKALLQQVRHVYGSQKQMP